MTTLVSADPPLPVTLVPCDAFDNDPDVCRRYSARQGFQSKCVDAGEYFRARLADIVRLVFSGAPCVGLSEARGYFPNELHQRVVQFDPLAPPNDLTFKAADAVVENDRDVGVHETLTSAMLRYDGRLYHRTRQPYDQARWLVFVFIIEEALCDDRRPSGGHETRLIIIGINPRLVVLCGTTFPDPQGVRASHPVGLLRHYRTPDDRVPDDLFVRAFDGPFVDIMPPNPPRCPPTCLGYVRATGSDGRDERAYVYDLNGILRTQTIAGRGLGGGTGLYLTAGGRCRRLTDFETAHVAHGWPVVVPFGTRAEAVNAWGARTTSCVLTALARYVEPYYRQNPPDGADLRDHAFARAYAYNQLPARVAFRLWIQNSRLPDHVVDVSQDRPLDVLVVVDNTYYLTSPPRGLIGCPQQARDYDGAVLTATRLAQRLGLECAPFWAGNIKDNRVLVAAAHRTGNPPKGLAWRSVAATPPELGPYLNLARARLAGTRPGDAAALALPFEASVGVGDVVRLPVPADVPGPDRDLYDAAMAARTASEDLLRHALATAPDDDDGYLATWTLRVGANRATIPVDAASILRQDNTPYLDEPFTAPPARTATTPPPRPPPPTQPHARPSHWTEILTPTARQAYNSAVEAQARDLRAYRAEGENAKRRFRKAIALSEDDIRPQYRGYVWDNRPESRMADGTIPVLDGSVPPETRLNTANIERHLQEHPDRAMVSNVVGGVDFDVHLPLQTVVQPHLTSLKDGFRSIDAEIGKLVADGTYRGYHEPAFIPTRYAPQGARARKLEARFRRVQNDSAPVKLLRDTAGERVVPFNEAINLHGTHLSSHGVQEPIPSPEAGDPPGATRRFRFPRERKPTVDDTMTDGCVLNAASALLGEPTYGLTDDFKSYFWQFGVANSYLWLTTMLWIDDDGRPLHVVSPALAMGNSLASLVAQNMAHAACAVLRDGFDADEAYEYALALGNDNGASPLRTWLETRNRLSVETGQNEARLYAVRVYTDDIRLQCVGPRRTARLLRRWRWTTNELGLVMAIAEKRDGGVVTWNGHDADDANGVLMVQEHKAIHAADVLHRGLNGRVTADEWRDNNSLLQHLLHYRNNQQDSMYGMWNALRGLGPTDLVPRKSLQGIRGTILAWIDSLMRIGSCSYHGAISSRPTTATMGDGHRRVFTLYTDAAKDGCERPALGGFLAGMFWAIPLTAQDLEAFSIPVLELAAIIVGLLTADHYLHGGALHLYTDSSTSMDVVRNRAHEMLMQRLHQRLLQSRPYQRLSANGLTAAHLRGAGNPLADLPSRGRFEELQQLCRQLRITARRIDPPRNAKHVLEGLRTLHRSADATSLENAQVFDMASDGPLKRRHHIPDAEQFSRMHDISRITAPIIARRRRRTYETRGEQRTVVNSATTPTIAPVAPDRTRPVVASTNALWTQRPSSLAPPGQSLELRPADNDWFTSLLTQMQSLQEDVYASSTNRTDDSHWRFWQSYCARLGTSPYRTDVDANSGRDVPGHNRETILVTGYVLDRAATMIPRAGRTVANPQSAMNSLRAVRRVHQLLTNVDLAAPRIVSKLIRAMIRRVVHEHGPEVLIPARKEPFPRRVVVALATLAHQTQLGPDLIVADDHPFWLNFRVWVCLSAQTGLRLNETSVPDGDTWHRGRLSRDHLTWRIRGATMAQPADEQLRRLEPGDAAILRPPTAKNDPFCLIWGDKPITLPYQSRHSCPFSAASALRDLVLRYPCPTNRRKDTPLLTIDGQSQPFRHSGVRRALHAALVHIEGPDLAKRYSAHSFRIYLACCLLARNRHPHLIQALLRWRGPQAVAIYARLNPSDYARHILEAATADPSSVTSHNLPRIDNDDVFASVNHDDLGE